MMNSFNLFAIMLLLRNVTSKQLEPTCSKFHYEEQLLAKAVKLESTIDDFIQQSGETTTEVKSNLERLEIEINQLKARLDKYDNEDANQPKSCPSSYTYNEETNLCWRLEKNKRHWFEARKTCFKEGGRLMILNTTEAVSIIQEYLRAEGAEAVFVGASDIFEEDNYKWIDGSDIGSVPWGSGQPSKNRAENCLIMYSAWEYKFGDDYCYGKYQFLCQI